MKIDRACNKNWETDKECLAEVGKLYSLNISDRRGLRTCVIQFLSKKGMPNHPLNKSEVGCSVGSGGGCAVSIIAKSELTCDMSIGVENHRINGDVGGVPRRDTEGKECIGRVVKTLN